MSKLRSFSNCQALFVGPAPATGFHFIDNYGSLSDNYSGLNSLNNLVHEIDRVNNFTYQLNFDRIELKHLGKRGLVDRPVINAPNITFSFDYFQNGLKNEARLGFNINYNRFEYPFTGQPFYSQRVCPISGFVTRSFSQPGAAPYWPLDYRDDRNIFAVIDKDGESIHDKYYNVEDFSISDLLFRANPRDNNLYVASFGNCRLVSYRTEAAINSIPKCSVGYIAENMQIVSGASGNLTPAVLTKNFSGVNKHFVIPESVNEGGPSVLLPGDITLDINQNQLVQGAVTGTLTGFYTGYAIGNLVVGSLFLGTGILSGNFIGQISGGFNTGLSTYSINQPTTISEISFQTLTKIVTGSLSGLYSGSYQALPTTKFTWNNLDVSMSYSYSGLDTGRLTGYGLVSGAIGGFHTGYITGIFSGDRNFFAKNLTIDPTDLKIQSYSIDLLLNREPLQSLGYKLPLDRKINFPVYANLSFNAIIGDDYTGNLFNQLQADEDYNICIKLKNPACSNQFPENFNPPAQEYQNPAGKIAIKYDFLKAKFISSSFQTNVYQNRVGTFNFSTEINPDDLSRGLFISGLLNVTKVEDYLINSTGDYIIIDNSENLLTVNYNVLY